MSLTKQAYIIHVCRMKTELWDKLVYSDNKQNPEMHQQNHTL